MKRLLLVCLMILCLLPLCGRAADVALYPIRENGLWGYMNRAGETVIEPRFAQADPFRGRFARVVLPSYEPDSPGLEGIIDREGNWALAPSDGRIQSKANFGNDIGGTDTGVYLIYDQHGRWEKAGYFDIPSGFCSGLIYEDVDNDWIGDIDVELICVTVDGNKGFAERSTGRIVISCQFEPIYYYCFEGNTCVVMMDGAGPNTWLLIDRAGSRSPMPGNCYIASLGSRFDEGLIPIRDAESDLYGYMNMEGHMVIEPQYLYAYDFSEGLACVETEPGRYAMIDPLNRIVFTRTDVAGTRYSDAYFAHGLIKFGMQEDGSVLFVNRDGNEAFRLEVDGLDYAGDFMDNGLAFYSVEQAQATVSNPDDMSLVGIYNTAGEILSPPCFLLNLNYKEIGWTEGVLAVTDDETRLMGFIDESAQWIIPPQYDSAAGFRDGLALVEKDGKLLYIDHNGTVVWEESQR